MRLIFLLYFTATTSASASCYYPSGSIAPADIPCNHNPTEDSACCGQGFICLSNGLCQNPLVAAGEFGLYSRGSCTDQSWTSSQCPKFCVGDSDVKTGGQEVLKCLGGDDLYYCNDSDVANANCSSGSNIITFAGTYPPQFQNNHTH